jgi:hypothetical protein
VKRYISACDVMEFVDFYLLGILDVAEFSRACRHLSQASAHTKCSPAR